MPRKKGKKSGSGRGQKKESPKKWAASGSVSSPAAQSNSAAVAQQGVQSTAAVPKVASQNPSHKQAPSISQEYVQQSRSSSQSTIVLPEHEPPEMTTVTSKPSKGKERAIDPPVEGFGDQPIAPGLDKQQLYDQLTALKVLAGLLDQYPPRWYPDMQELERSGINEDLIDRARRMLGIQERTQADYPELAIERLDGEELIWRLVAIQEVKWLSRTHAEIIFKNSAMFPSHYKFGAVAAWSSRDDIPTKHEDPDLQGHKTRWLNLTYVLREDPQRYMNLKDAVDQDFVKMGYLLGNDSVKATVDAIFQLPEFTKFCADESGGLVIHGYDQEYRERVKNQSRGLKKHWKERQTTSRLSGFMHRFATEFKGPGVVLVHSGGLCNTYRHPDTNLDGWRGLFRSLCNQLIAQQPYKSALKLFRLTAVQLACIEESKVFMDPLFKLFRDLIVDVAELGVKANYPVQQIIVIIDGIEWFECRKDTTAYPSFDKATVVKAYKDVLQKFGRYSVECMTHRMSMTRSERKIVEDLASTEWVKTQTLPEGSADAPGAVTALKVDDVDWEKVVEFFRDLTTECYSTELGTRVHFKYILLHPLSSRIGAKPSVVERYITLDEDL